MANTLPRFLLLTGVAAAAGLAADVWAESALRVSAERVSVGPESRLVGEAGAVLAPRSQTEPASPGQPSTDPVVERDIFGAGRLDSLAPPAGLAPGISSLALATTVVDPEGGFAVAWLGEDGERPRAYAVGDRLYGREVVEIRQRMVILQGASGVREEIGMRGLDLESGRRSASRTRGAVAAFSGRTSSLSGYRLSGLAKGDPLFDQGLRDGDVLHRVAGVAVASDRAAHLAFETARLVGPVDVDLTRDGQRSTLSILLP